MGKVIHFLCSPVYEVYLSIKNEHGVEAFFGKKSNPSGKKDTVSSIPAQNFNDTLYYSLVYHWLAVL